MANIQVTHDASVNNARSESNIVINPNNPMQIVGGSKKFRNIQTYDFTLATAYSADGGHTWYDSADVPLSDKKLKLSWTILSDPALAWDDSGNVFLVGLAGNNPPNINIVGIAVYKSTDYGKTWGPPDVIHQSGGDDKQWAAGDGRPGSPFRGRVYAVWDDGGNMRFARTLDHGKTWIGTGTLGHYDTPGSVIATGSFSPEINVSASGTVYVVWISGSDIKMIVSTDGGDSFHQVASPATGVTTLGSSLPIVDGWSVFPGGNFRVLTLPTACPGTGQTLVVAWADYRDGISRIYCALSNNGGASWVTGPSGVPLLKVALPANQQHFQPQLISNPNGVIGCTFYEFGPKPTTPMIDVKMAKSKDNGATFSVYYTVTDKPWDPTIDAPWSHGDPKVTFIGDYFGIDASTSAFFPLWTDTRTGIQELFTDISSRNCFIATAAYGSPVHPHVEFLREYRDRVLLESSHSRWFERLLEVYYSFSPPIAAAMIRSRWLKGLLRYTLVLPLVLFLRGIPLVIRADDKRRKPIQRS